MQFKALQKIGGSHKFEVEKDGRGVTAYVHYEMEQGEVGDSAKIPDGDRLVEKLLKLGYVQLV